MTTKPPTAARQHHQIGGAASPRATRFDAWLAVGVGTSALAVYLPTLLPGIGGGGDSAKFQYLGHVLGTAHAPGYPAYVLISHLFSYLPIGSLAYRMNLMSAVWSAVGSALMYTLVRRLGGSRLAAAAAGFGMAFGRVYWSKAVQAEVYSLAAALETAVLVKVIDWSLTGRRRDLYWAVAIAAVAFGNHLTIAFAVPALVAFVLLTDARSVLRPRVLLTTGLLVFAGFAQYLFVMLRTRQHAPYIEAAATDVSELMNVVLARKYAYEMWVFDVPTLVSVRLPALLTMVRGELGLAATLLLVPGAIWLARSRPREAVLLALGFAGLLSVTANVDADVDGFMVPAFVFVWPVVGIGLSVVADAWRWAKVPRLVPVTAAALAALVAVPQAIGNYRPNDHHGRTFEARYMRSLFGILPPKTVLVKEAYSVDQLVLYKLLGEDAAGGRDIRLIAPDAESLWPFVSQGYHLFAFEAGHHELEGFGYTFSPIPLRDVTLGESLRSFPVDSIVVVVAGPDIAGRLARADALAPLGSHPPRPESGLVLATVGVVGDSNAIERFGYEDVGVTILRNQRISGTGARSPVTITARAGRLSTISIDGKQTVQVEDGLAMTALTAGGRLIGQRVMHADTWPYFLFDPSEIPLYEATAVSRCEAVGDGGWHEVTTAVKGADALLVRVDNYRPFEADAVVYLGGDGVEAPRVGQVQGTGRPQVDARVFRQPGAGADDPALIAALARDGVSGPLADRLRQSASACRVSLRVNDEGQSVTISLLAAGEIHEAIARARVDRPSARRAQVCGRQPLAPNGSGPDHAGETPVEGERPPK